MIAAPPAAPGPLASAAFLALRCVACGRVVADGGIYPVPPADAPGADIAQAYCGSACAASAGLWPWRRAGRASGHLA